VRTAILLIVCVGCAHAPAAEAPQPTGGRWRELTSPHFVLRTDTSSVEARRVLLGLEKNYAVLEVLKEFTFATRPGPEGRIVVVLFQRREDFGASTGGPKQRDGFNTERDGQTYVVVHEPLFVGVLNHELVHGFVRHYLWRAPTWLNEGLAEFYSNFRIEGDKVTFGLIPHRAIRRTRFPPLETVMKATAQQFYDDPTHTNDYYAASAMLVHMLSDDAEDRKHFNVYLAALAQGVPADDAWKQGFGDTSIEKLDHRLRGYVGQKEWSGWQTSFTPPPGQILGERELEDFEVKLVLVQVGDWTSPGWPLRIAKLLEEARAEHPNDPKVLYWSGRSAQMRDLHDDAKRFFLAAVQLDPDVGRYWMALAEVELKEMAGTPVPKRRPGPALERLRQFAQSTDELNMVAWYLSEIGKPTEGIPYIVRALEKAPGCYPCRDTMAQIFFQKGAIARAVDEQRLAVNLIPETARGLRKQYGDRLTRYENAAREAARPAVPPPAPLPAPTAPVPAAPTPPDEPPQ
jgi:tetratricopeptide (TPR) repeat protein